MPQDMEGDTGGLSNRTGFGVIAKAALVDSTRTSGFRPGFETTASLLPLVA